MRRWPRVAAVAALLVGLSGCVSYREHSLAPLSAWPPMAAVDAPSAYLRTTALVRVRNQAPIGAAGAASAAWEQAVLETLRDSGRLGRLSTAQVPSTLYIEATITQHEQFSVAAAVITGATFFIVPSTSVSTYTLDTVFRDSHGQERGRVSKSERVRTWMQLLLVVAVPFQQDTAEVVRALAKSTVQEAVQRGLM